MNFHMLEKLNINFLLREFVTPFEQSYVDSVTVTSTVFYYVLMCSTTLLFYTLIVLITVASFQIPVVP